MIDSSIVQSISVIFSINLLGFIFAYLFKTDKLTDLLYGLSFVTAAIFILSKGGITSAKLVLVIMISLWGIRLAAYLLIRILKTGKDRRFDTIRADFLKFGGFWLLQAVTVTVIIWPSLVFLTKKPIFGTANILGILVWSIGLLIEAIADYQKFVFKLENKTKWISSGLWKYSRHPNYFGEILCWWGIFMFAFPALKSWEYVGIISPIFITYMLLFVSGIPILEKRYEKKYGSNPEYIKYKQKTSLLIPFPPYRFDNKNK